MKKLHFFVVICLLISAYTTQAQIGFGTTNPDSSSLADMVATNKGVLLPRVALTGTNDVSTITSPANYLTVMNTASAGTTPNNVTPGYYFFFGSQWIKVGTDAVEPWLVQGTTDKATLNTQNIYQSGNVAVNKTGGTFLGTQSAFFVGENPGITGISVTNWTETNRANSSGTSDIVYGQVSRTNYSGSAAISLVGASNPIGRISGSGNADALYGTRNQSQHRGTGQVGFLAGSSNIAEITTAGSANRAYGTYGSLEINNAGASATDAASIYGYLALQRGAIAEANGLKLDITNVGATINGDISFIKGVAPGNANSLVVGGKKRFIFYQGNWESDFSGIINVLNPVTAIESASNKVLTTKEYFDKYTLGWRKSDGTNATSLSDDIYKNGKVGIGITVPQAKLHVVKTAADITPAIIQGCNVYADNGSATTAGVPVGGLYRTATGVLMVRY